MNWLARQRLLIRILVNGVLLLTVAAIVSFELYSILMRPQFDYDSGRLQTFIASDACARVSENGGDPPGHRRYESTVYKLDGTLVRTWITPEFPPVEGKDLEVLKATGRVDLQGKAQARQAFLCADLLPGAYAVVGPSPLRFSFDRAALMLAISILAVAIGAVPLVRSITQPIERIAAATRAFGKGDFSARAPTDRKDEIGDLAHVFNDTADRLVRLMRAEKELMANVSHELRTPLARIRVVLESAQEDPARAQALLQEIEYDLNDLERLVEDVMETMRLDTGSVSGDLQLPVRLEEIDGSAFLTNAGQRFIKNHSKRSLTVDVPAELRFQADERLLRRVIDNLLDNARKYSEENSTIVLRGRSLGGQVHISIEDRGIGIDKEDLGKVFTPFFRTDRSRSRATGGAGLGLALAKRIVDAHDGRIEVESEVGTGTHVHVVLKGA